MLPARAQFGMARLRNSRAVVTKFVFLQQSSVFYVQSLVPGTGGGASADGRKRALKALVMYYAAVFFA